MPLWLLKLFTGKNIVILIIVILVGSLWWCNQSKKGAIGELMRENAILQVELSEREVTLYNLKANIQLLKNKITLMDAQQSILETNIDELIIQLEDQEKQYGITIAELRKSLEICEGTTVVCTDPNQVEGIDIESSKKYLTLLNEVIK